MKIRIRPSFLMYLLCVGLFASIETALAVLVALLIHELAHLLTAWALGEAIASVELTPFGGLMTYRQSPSKGLKGVLVALAGPLGNYAILLLFSIPAVQEAAGETLGHRVIIANLSMLLLNLMPALPLDGGRLLFSLGYYLFDVSHLTAFLCVLGMALGGGLVLLGIYGAIHYGILNASLPIVGFYLMACAKRTAPIMLAENLYTVIQERLMRRNVPVCLSLFQVPAEMRLCETLSLLSRTHAAAFFVEKAGKTHIISEQAVCQAMLKEPNAPIDSLLHEENASFSAILHDKKGKNE